MVVLDSLLRRDKQNSGVLWPVSIAESGSIRPCLEKQKESERERDPTSTSIHTSPLYKGQAQALNSEYED